jgi:hypothetical protein
MLRTIRTFQLVFLAAWGLLLPSSLSGQPCLFLNIDPNINKINGLVETSNGTLWIATDLGAYERDPFSGAYTYHSLDQRSMPVSNVKNLNGDIYMLTDSGAYHRDNGSWQKFSIASGLPSNVVNDMAVDQNGNLWFATNAGIAVFDGTNYMLHTPFTDNRVIGLGVRNNRVYASNMSTSEPDIYYNGLSWQSLPSNPSFGGNRTGHFFFDGLGNMYTESYYLGKRIHKYFNNQWTPITSSASSGAVLSGNTLFILIGDYFLGYDGSSLDTLQTFCTSPKSGYPLFAQANGLNRFYCRGVHDGLDQLINTGIQSDQISGSLQNSKLTASVSSDGALFRDYRLDKSATQYNGYAQLNRKDKPGKPMIFAANLWVTANFSGTELASANRYLREDAAFFSGPVSNRYDVDYLNTYDRVWHIKQSEIDAHITQAGSAGYTMPEAIANWPGNGNSSKGEAPLLAPFNDVNGNGIYEPVQGEHPIIKGDEAVFFITNDHRAPRLLNQGNTMKLEVHGMLYLYDTSDVHIANALFMEYSIFNRSSNNLTDVRPGMWADFDLGNAMDDALATDTTNKLVYAFNLDNFDEGPNGFGSNIPAAGFVFLSSKLNGTLFYTNTAPGNPPAAMRSPQTNADYVHFMHQRWKDGKPLVQELPNGDGYGDPAQHPVTNYHYETNSGWQYGLSSYDNRSIATATPQATLAPNESMCVSLAFISALDAGGSALGSAGLLFNRAAAVDSFYTAKGLGCSTHIISLEETPDLSSLVMYPNPTDGKVYLELPPGVQLQSLEVYGLSGQRLLGPAAQTEIDLTPLPTGIYLLQGKLKNGQQFVEKLMKY